MMKMTKERLVDAINQLMLTEDQYGYRKEFEDGTVERYVFLPPSAERLSKRSLVGIHALAQMARCKTDDLLVSGGVRAKKKLEMIEAINALFPEAAVPLLPADKFQRGVRFVNKDQFVGIHCLAVQVCEVREPGKTLRWLREHGKPVPDLLQELYWLDETGQPKRPATEKMVARDLRRASAAQSVRQQFEEPVLAFLREQGIRARSVDFVLEFGGRRRKTA